MGGSGADLFPNAARARQYGAHPEHPAGAGDGGDADAREPDAEDTARRDGSSGGADRSTRGGGDVEGGTAADDGGPSTETVPAVRAAPGGAGDVAALQNGPARWGWRGAINRSALGLVRLRPAAAELAHRQRERRVRTNLLFPRFVVVANPKGGCGKTPVTLLLAATYGSYRGGYTLAWDNNETRGTLGLRGEPGPEAPVGSVVDLVNQIPAIQSTGAHVGWMARFVHPQSAHFDVLASDETPGLGHVIDGVAFERLRRVLARFYRLTVVDTGNNARAANWWAAVRTASCLVVPTTVRADSADAGLWMLEHLRRLGGQRLVAQAVAVVTCAERRVDQALLAAIVGRYRQVVREVVVVPFDPAIEAGTRVSYHQLGESTRRALLAAAAAVIDSLPGVPPAQ